MQTPDSTTPPQKPPFVRDDLAYILPMLTFLLFTWVGGTFPDYYTHTYVAKTVVVSVMIALFWRSFTRISWRGWWLGLIVGVIGIFQWVGMQTWLQNNFEFFAPPEDVFNPTTAFDSAALMYSFIGIRWILGATLLVPLMEELFWRDFVWRTVAAPNDFKLASVGELDWRAFFIVPLVFAVVHGNWWMTSIVWGVMISALLVYTRSLGACIVAHATTNFLLGAYVLYTKDWAFW